MPKAAVPTAQISSSRGTSPTGLGGPGYKAYHPEYIHPKPFEDSGASCRPLVSN